MSEKIAVIRHGDSLHAEFFRPRDKFLDAAKSVEQGIFAVYMQMRKQDHTLL